MSNLTLFFPSFVKNVTNNWFFCGLIFCHSGSDVIQEFPNFPSFRQLFDLFSQNLLKKEKRGYKLYISIWRFSIVKIWSRKFRLLTNISIFDKNFVFLQKFRFSTKISIFYKNFDCLKKFRFSIKVLIFDKNFDVR